MITMIRRAGDVSLRISSLRKKVIFLTSYRQNSPKIKTGVIRFHPRDIRKEIMKQFATRTKSPLDKVFFTG